MPPESINQCEALLFTLATSTSTLHGIAGLVEPGSNERLRLDAKTSTVSDAGEVIAARVEKATEDHGLESALHELHDGFMVELSETRKAIRREAARKNPSAVVVARLKAQKDGLQLVISLLRVHVNLVKFKLRETAQS